MVSMILFDVDGVLLSEERYFDATALTLWEMLFSPTYLGLPGEPFETQPSEDTIRAIRKKVFVDDQILDLMKNRGINSNWDMVYLSFAHQLLCILEQLLPAHREEVTDIIQREITYDSLRRIAGLLKDQRVEIEYERFLTDFGQSAVEKQDLLLYLNDLVLSKLQVETHLFGATSSLWQLCQETFQEWYLGDELVVDNIGRAPTQQGKRGFLSDEIPIVAPQEMAATLSALQEKGITLGIGTGRPTVETMIPLQEMGLLDYFEADRIVTASHVLNAERERPEYAPLSKPQPFCYIKGWLGMQATTQQCMETPLPIIDVAETLLIVGDSVADLMAAQRIGCRFAAVLTGLSGQAARAQFEELGADYILDDMRQVVEIVGEEQN
ncbi:phosphatase [Ammoniphilus oxalaticus]|uniref:Phosphatase n=1 Tax=Ammoniphilus oxalaticus TaxID=66863 RepID=A0A419SN79_9BACL|nr:HAD family hydrolase [Ammoniphilus oxalaticus]RKD25669.1 phosphatase [Ammoniphilus oxalaticus]